MPELPEVETTKRGIAPHVLQRQIQQVIVRQPRLRWPVPEQIQLLQHASITAVERRAKYLLLNTSQGSAIIHLGMSGSLRLTPSSHPPEKHDHVDLVLDNAFSLRLRDPRRFGAVLFQAPHTLHPLLINLGVEPLSEAFNAPYLAQVAANRRTPIKTFLMNAQYVVGVGNIYANEALFRAGVHPERSAGCLAAEEYAKLVEAIKAVLAEAIQQGGTTLRDFVREDGQSGYFQMALQVYGRTLQPCVKCATPLQQIRQAQRSTWYCPCCQPALRS